MFALRLETYSLLDSRHMVISFCHFLLLSFQQQIMNVFMILSGIVLQLAIFSGISDRYCSCWYDCSSSLISKRVSCMTCSLPLNIFFVLIIYLQTRVQTGFALILSLICILRMLNEDSNWTEMMSNIMLLETFWDNSFGLFVIMRDNFIFSTVTDDHLY